MYPQGREDVFEVCLIPSANVREIDTAVEMATYTAMEIGSDNSQWVKR